MQQRFSGRDGLVRFAGAVTGSLVDQEVVTEDPERFDATLQDVPVGQAHLISASVGPLRSRRDRASGADAGSVFLLLTRDGRGTIAHRGGEEPIAPELLTVVPGGERFVVDYPVRASLLFVALPAAAVARQWPGLDGPVRSVALDGVGRPVAAQLPLVLDAALASTRRDEHDLAALLDSVLHLVLRGSLGDTAGDPLLALRVSAERVAEQHLDDPDLSVPWLARRLAVSVRQLHRAFGTGELTPAAHLRRQRLRASARALTATPAMPVAEVAARYGFASASHLGAAFRAAYGEPPGSWRARHAADGDRAPIV